MLLTVDGSVKLVRCRRWKKYTRMRKTKTKEGTKKMMKKKKKGNNKRKRKNNKKKIKKIVR